MRAVSTGRPSSSRSVASGRGRGSPASIAASSSSTLAPAAVCVQAPSRCHDSAGLFSAAGAVAPDAADAPVAAAATAWAS